MTGKCHRHNIMKIRFTEIHARPRFRKHVAGPPVRTGRGLFFYYHSFFFFFFFDKLAAALDTQSSKRPPPSSLLRPFGRSASGRHTTCKSYIIKREFIYIYIYNMYTRTCMCVRILHMANLNF